MNKYTFFILCFVTTAAILLSPILVPINQGHVWRNIDTIIMAFVVLVLVKNFLHLMLNPWYDLKVWLRDRRLAHQRYEPLVSVLIPAWNEEVGIVTTMQSVLANTYQNLEVIVIDDGSTDATLDTINAFITDLPRSVARQKSIKVIDQHNGGKGSALNRGVSNAAGDIIVTIDADCYVDRYAIAEIVKRFKDPSISAVMGQVRIGNTRTLAGLTQCLEYLLTFSYKKTASLFNTMYVVGGAAAAYRREVFDTVGRFDSKTITEDIDLSIRILQSGGKIEYVERAIIYTEGASDFFNLIKQRLRWRRGRHDALLKNKGLFFSRQNKNRLFSFVTLPLSLLNELLLLLEPAFFLYIIYISVTKDNFLSFVTLIVITTYILTICILFSNYFKKYSTHIFLAPISWLIFYLTVYVEYVALTLSLFSIVARRQVKWQRWQRLGVGDSESTFWQALARLHRHTSTAIIVILLVSCVGFFYLNIFAGGVIASSLLMAVFFAGITDGAFLSLHLARKPFSTKKKIFDPSKVTVVIVCYNGEKVIGETITQALTKVPPEQIMVISDNSKDRTVEIAKSFGVTVYENEKNYNKALSINRWAHKIQTEYALILDDDTHIEHTLIPTNLLDEGYSAVAFNVMPEETGTLINKLQIYEYRKSMYLGKELRASVGAIGNVSGAIGLFRTKDLITQARKHSGQFGGEDQQRTMLVHLSGEGKGIVYTNSTVYTEVPDTIRALFRQRAFRWGTAVHETFVLCLKILFNPKVHYLLKVERAYLLFVLFTDPIRMVLLPFLFLHPTFFGILYLVYLVFDTAAWLKTQRKDPYWIVLLTPFYNILKNIGRFIAHFYWYRMKYHYVIKNRFHTLITDRGLVLEYSITTVFLVFFWVLTGTYIAFLIRHFFLNVLV